MGKMNVAQNIHIVPLTAPYQSTATFTPGFINMKQYEKVEFICHLSAVAANGYTMTVTQSAVTAGSTSTAKAARYRITAAAGTDTMGATTALATTGLAITTAHSTLTLIVDVESQDLTTESLPYVGLTFTHSGSADLTACIFALCWPKYPKETNANALT